MTSGSLDQAYIEGIIRDRHRNEWAKGLVGLQVIGSLMLENRQNAEIIRFAFRAESQSNFTNKETQRVNP